MDPQTQITITVLNNKLNAAEIRINKLENSFKKLIDEMKRLTFKNVVLTKKFRDLDTDIDFARERPNE